MSFEKYKNKVEDGDTVIIYLSHENMQPLKVQKGQTLQTRYGALKHVDMIGVPYGSKIDCRKGWLYILHPTPELWTLTVPHRTQILYTTDISMITFQLDLKPGSVVVEAGTGSGSLSHSIIRCIMPTGHLYTFEFHEERSQKAAEEFKVHGLADYVTVTHRDVCGKGFQLDHVADAVFLDLPSPWDCISSATQALKKQGGRICIFVPCIEQVQRSCEALTSHGFGDLTTLECLLRNFNVKKVTLPIADLGQSDLEDKDCTKDILSKVKVIKTGEEPMESEDTECIQDEDVKNTVTKKERSKRKMCSDNFEYKTGAPSVQTQGHTGFLTFGTLYSS